MTDCDQTGHVYNEVDKVLIVTDCDQTGRVMKLIRCSQSVTINTSSTSLHDQSCVYLGWTLDSSRVSS